MKNQELFNQNIIARDKKIIEAIDKRAEYNRAKGASKTHTDGKYIHPEVISAFAPKTDFHGRDIKYNSDEARFNTGLRHIDEILKNNLEKSRKLGAKACELCGSYYDGSCTWIFERGFKNLGEIVGSNDKRVDIKKLYNIRNSAKREVEGKEPISECFDKYHLNANERKKKNANNPRVVLAEPTSPEQDD